MVFESIYCAVAGSNPGNKIIERGSPKSNKNPGGEFSARPVFTFRKQNLDRAIEWPRASKLLAQPPRLSKRLGELQCVVYFVHPM
jgi:hypothetical protein